MALYARDGSVQKSSTTIFGRPPVLLMEFGHVISECGRCVSAERSLAKTGADEVHDNPRLRHGKQVGKLTDREYLHKLA
jgi:D-serine deaminase-like pyridoxal phosphate-dependent protein